MKENLFDIIIVLLILIFIGIGILFFLLELKEFYNDYKCSTTTDFTYYIDNSRRFER